MDNYTRWRVILSCLSLIVLIFLLYISSAEAAGSPTKSKFYDFSEQLIDGEVRKPQALYMDVRQRVKFKRLLRLKRNFLGERLRQTARQRIFK
jgi:hypothetical protein